MSPQDCIWREGGGASSLNSLSPTRMREPRRQQFDTLRYKKRRGKHCCQIENNIQAEWEPRKSLQIPLGRAGDVTKYYNHACPQPVSGGIVYIKYCVCKIRHLVLCTTTTTTDGRQYLLNIFCMSTETDRLSTGMVINGQC